MSKKQIETYLHTAINTLYLEAPDLIRYEVNERSIVTELYSRLKGPFETKGWSVNVEYNREGNNGDPKMDKIGKMIPDIIVHTRGVKKGPNLLAIEVKGFWNLSDREVDVQKLRRLRDKYGYQFLYRIELEKDKGVLIEIDPV